MKIKKTYRDQLVDRIRWAALELIDRSDDFIGKDCEGITDFTIKINFTEDGFTEIMSELSVVCKNELRKL